MCPLYAHPRKDLAKKLTSVLSCQLTQNSSQSCRWLPERKLVRSLDNLCQQKQGDLEFEEMINELDSNIKGLQETLVNNQFNKITILKHIFEELESLKIIPGKEQQEDSESTAAENRQQSRSNYGEHLLAYLQESCLRAAKKAYWKTEYIEHQHSELDLLGNARERVMLGLQGKSNLFNKFDWRTRTGALETYIRSFLELRLVSEIEQEYKIQRRTPWGWLKHINGPRQRPNALVNLGISKLEIESYLLIWHCFDEIYASVEPDNNNRLPEPSDVQHQQMTSRYNQLLARLQQPGIEINCQEYIRRLEVCSKAAKDYGSVDTRTTSLDIRDENNNPVINPEDLSNTNSLQNIIERELAIEEQKLLKSFLDERLGKLTEEQKKLIKKPKKLTEEQISLLKLNSYGFNQSSIGQLIQRDQGSVSRRFNTIYTRVSKDFYKEYSVNNSEKKPTIRLDAVELAKILEAINKMIKFSLDASYKQEVDKLLATTYINNVDESQKSLHFKIHENDEQYSDRLEPIKRCLVEILKTRVKDNQFDIPNDAQKTVTKALSEFVEDWLEENSPQQIALIAEQ